MSAKNAYLEFHGQQWRVIVFVPRDVQRGIGAKRLKRGLGTADLRQANDLKWSVVAEFKRRIAEERRLLAIDNPALRLAAQSRLPAKKDDTGYEIDHLSRKVERTKGPQAADEFYKLASGQTNPLELHQDDFLSFKADYRPTTQGDFKRVIGWLGAWLKVDGKAATLEAIDRKVAGRFIERFLCVGRSRDKASAYMAFLREYWKWLEARGHTFDNPWLSQPLPSAPRPDRRAAPDGGKRPFTDPEVKTLLAGDAGPLLNDLMRIAALSGMRLEEICQLQVSDCADNTFRILSGKTTSARRAIPIHSGLADIIRRRTEGKPSDHFLIDDLPPLTNTRESRSDPASKRFVRYRRKMKVDERPNDKAKSNVDFHSWRRWFIRKARDGLLAGNAGYDEWTFPAVVGHSDSDRPKSLDLAMMTYAGKDFWDAKRALVEAVKLPS